MASFGHTLMLSICIPPGALCVLSVTQLTTMKGKAPTTKVFISTGIRVRMTCSQKQGAFILRTFSIMAWSTPTRYRAPHTFNGSHLTLFTSFQDFTLSFIGVCLLRNTACLVRWYTSSFKTQPILPGASTANRGSHARLIRCEMFTHTRCEWQDVPQHGAVKSTKHKPKEKRMKKYGSLNILQNYLVFTCVALNWLILNFIDAIMCTNTATWSFLHSKGKWHGYNLLAWEVGAFKSHQKQSPISGLCFWSIW